MALDHAQNLRIGQKGASATPGIQLVTLASLPEVAFRGQMVYALDLDEFRVFDGDAWQIPTANVAAGHQVFVQGTAPVADAVGDQWLRNTDYQLFVWDGTTWQPVQDPTADAAAAAAASAAADALDALDIANNAQSIADGKVEIFYTTLAPEEPDFSPKPDDLWFRTSDNRLFRRVGTAWVEIQDQSIVDAIAAAGTAQATADQKITTYYLPDPPWANGTSGHGNDIGDLWFDTNNGNKAYRWDGNWVSVQDEAIAVAQATADAALVAAAADGLPPASSPDCEMIGGVGAILFRWPLINNPDPVQYRVYMDTQTGVTADPALLVGVTMGSQLTARNLNDGTPLVYGQTYYGIVQASDDDGMAAPGAEAFGEMVQINSPDVAAEYVYAGNILVDQLLAGTLSADVVMGATLRTALTGQRVEIGPLGIITYDSLNVPQTVLPSGTGETNTFKGVIEAAGITATGAISMRSTDNEVTRGAAVTLQSGVTASKSTPTVVVDWETVNLDTVTGLGGMPQALLGPQHAVAMCGIGARFLVLFKNASTYGYATFNADGTAYTAGPQLVSSFTSSYNQIMCKSLTSPVILQNGRSLERQSWAGSRTFFDDFSGTLSQWTSTTNTAITSGVARITTPATGTGNMVGPVRTMREKTYTAKITSSGMLSTQSWTYRAQFDASNYCEFAVNPSGSAANTLRIRYVKAGTANTTSITLDPVQHQQFRIEHKDTLINFYTSPAATSWTTRKTVTHSYTNAQLDGMHPEITATAAGTALLLDIDNVEINWTNRTEFYSSSDTETPALGTDGTDWWVTEMNSASPPAFVINTMDDYTMRQISSTTTGTNAGFKGTPSGLLKVTDAAWTGAHWVLASKSNGQHYWPFLVSTGAYEPNNAFAVPTGGSKGVAYDGTIFWSLNASGQLAKHTTNTWTSSGDPETWWACFSWYDSNATGGTHETTMSPQASFSQRKRARYTITTPSIPTGLGGTDDVDSARLFIGRGTTAPARTAMWLQGTTATGMNSMTFSSGTFSGTNPLAASTFVTSGATAGKLRNPDDSLVISGDGSILATAMNIGTTPVNTLTQNLQAASTANQDLANSTEVDVTGATVTFTTVRPNAKFVCHGSFYWAMIAASSGVAVGKLSVDGVVQAQFANYTGLNTTPDRANVAQHWVGTLAAAGSHTLKLRALAPGVTGTATTAAHRLQATHTTISVQVFE